MNDEYDIEDTIHYLDNCTVFPEILNLFLSRRGMLANHLAGRMKMSAAAVSQWLSNKRLPEIETVYKIALVLNLSDIEMEDLIRARQATSNAKDLATLLRVAEEHGNGQKMAKQIMNTFYDNFEYDDPLSDAA